MLMLVVIVDMSLFMSAFILLSTKLTYLIFILIFKEHILSTTTYFRLPKDETKWLWARSICSFTKRDSSGFANTLYVSESMIACMIGVSYEW
jgi:hypothetical protein